MDSVRTFVRYQSISGADPFDDLRILEYHGKLFEANIDGVENEYVEYLGNMVSVFSFARTDEPIEYYKLDDELSLSKGIGILTDAFKSIIDNRDDLKSVYESEASLAALLPNSVGLDISNKQDRMLLKFKAYEKKNALNIFLNNIIQVGMTIESMLNMEYEQAVMLVNYRAKVLEEQQEEQKNRR